MRLLRTLAVAATLCAADLLVSTCLPPPDDCTPTATRCNGQSAEICDGATRWTMIMDCAEVGAQSGGTWVCCEVPPDSEMDAGDASPDASADEHICVPADQCPGGAS